MFYVTQVSRGGGLRGSALVKFQGIKGLVHWVESSVIQLVSVLLFPSFGDHWFEEGSWGEDLWASQLFVALSVSRCSKNRLPVQIVYLILPWFIPSYLWERFDQLYHRESMGETRRKLQFYESLRILTNLKIRTAHAKVILCEFRL